MAEWNKEIIPGVTKLDLKPREIRKKTKEEIKDLLGKLQDELMHERGVASMGGAPMSPGKIRSLRRNIACVLTIIGEEARALALKASQKKAPKPKMEKADLKEEKAEPKKAKSDKKVTKKVAKAPKSKKKKE